MSTMSTPSTPLTRSTVPVISTVRRRALAIGALVLGLPGGTVGLTLSPAAATPPAYNSVSLAPSPATPYAPLEVNVTGEACGDPTVEVVAGNEPATDNYYQNSQPAQTKTAAVAPDGTWSTSFDFPVALPGDWVVTDSCSTFSTIYSVPTPADSTPVVSPTVATVGAHASVGGHHCTGGKVEYFVGPDVFSSAGLGPVPFPPEGTITPNADGSWGATITYTGENGTGDVKFRSKCIYPNGAVVHFAAVDVKVEAATGTSGTNTTASTSPSTPTAAAATPRFTG